MTWQWEAVGVLVVAKLMLACMVHYRCQPLRVTHSIPDSCGLILRSEHGTIVHTGDWNIDVSPVDGESFARSMFEHIGMSQCHLPSSVMPYAGSLCQGTGIEQGCSNCSNCSNDRMGRDFMLVHDVNDF